MAFSIDALGAGEYSDSLLTAAAMLVFPLAPNEIIEVLHLRNPGFVQFVAYGHFQGRSA